VHANSQRLDERSLVVRDVLGDLEGERGGVNDRRAQAPVSVGPRGVRQELGVVWWRGPEAHLWVDVVHACVRASVRVCVRACVCVCVCVRARAREHAVYKKVHWRVCRRARARRGGRTEACWSSVLTGKELRATHP
jgi:hypothetical protein